LDTDHDGKISRSEWVARFGTEEGFEQYDLDSDGVLDLEEQHQCEEKQFHMKIIDFGIACPATKGEKIRDDRPIRLDSRDFCASPEMKEYYKNLKHNKVKGDGYDAFKADIFAVGMLCAIMIGGARLLKMIEGSIGKAQKTFNQADTDGDGKISRAEWIGKFGNDKMFDAYDRDGSGLVSREEWMLGERDRAGSAYADKASGHSKLLSKFAKLKCSDDVKEVICAMMAPEALRFPIEKILLMNWFQAEEALLQAQIIDRQTLGSLKKLRHFKHVVAHQGDWVVLEKYGPRSMFILDDATFRKRYDLSTQQPVKRPKDQQDQNALHASKLRMNSFESSIERLYMKINETEMRLLHERWPEVKVTKDESGLSVSGTLPSQAAMLEFIEGHILDPARKDGGLGDPEGLRPFKVYVHGKHGVYAMQVEDEKSEYKTLIFHSPAEERPTEFCFYPRPWADGSVTPGPIAIGDYLAYIPGDDSAGTYCVEAEVYRVGGEKFNMDSGQALYYQKSETQWDTTTSLSDPVTDHFDHPLTQYSVQGELIHVPVELEGMNIGMCNIEDMLENVWSRSSTFENLPSS